VSSKEALALEIGARVKKLRMMSVGSRRPLTQKELADEVGITRTSITNIESGNQLPPISVIYRMSEVLNVELAELLPKLSDTRFTGKSETEPVSIGQNIYDVPPITAQFLKEFMKSPELLSAHE
jgi:transcriptional regulator with XRE-family HTH domain